MTTTKPPPGESARLDEKCPTCNGPTYVFRPSDDDKKWLDRCCVWGYAGDHWCRTRGIEAPRAEAKAAEVRRRVGESAPQVGDVWEYTEESVCEGDVVRLTGRRAQNDGWLMRESDGTETWEYDETFTDGKMRLVSRAAPVPAVGTREGLYREALEEIRGLETSENFGWIQAALRSRDIAARALATPQQPAPVPERRPAREVPVGARVVPIKLDPFVQALADRWWDYGDGDDHWGVLVGALSEMLAEADRRGGT